jgi:methionyl-tRNA synthetase
MMERFYVTTPIYYVNDDPHIGHAYTTVLADVLAGYSRIFGKEVFFLTGTDEHGQKLQSAAAERGREPLEYCDEMVVRFQRAWEKLGIRYDDFIRTTEDRHKSVVQKILQQIYEKGEIYSDDYEGWYCVHEERFWTEKDLVDGNCPDCNRPVSRITEKNYFFRMSKYQGWLIDYINTNPEFIRPDFRRNEVLGFLRQPLGDLCISRPKSRLSWGIELPFDKDYVCYVWFDALINYISAIGYLSDEGKFEKWWPAVHLIGKDILTTHAVYWPCMLKAIGIRQPKTIFAHGWWLAGETKMSKSRGNVINPLELADKYGVDAFRYFVIREMTLGQDATYSEESFIARYNSDLANDLGNLVSRVLKMIGSYCDGRIPQPGTEFRDNDLFKKWVGERNKPGLQIKADNAIQDFRLNKGLERIMEFVRYFNAYIERHKPWELAKSGHRDRLNDLLYNSAVALRKISVYLSPIMPSKCEEIQTQLGVRRPAFRFEKYLWDPMVHGDDEGKGDLGSLVEPGAAIKPGKALFPRLQKPEVEAKKEEGMPQGVIDFEEFGKVQLKTAKVVDAEKVEGADKLLKLEIDLGGEKRQIVAGIAQHYAAEEMKGKTLIVVSNLKPAKIRGIESNGMLLAAQADGDLVLLTTDREIAPGAGVS